MTDHVFGPDLNQVRAELHEALRIHGEGRMSVHAPILRALAILDGKDPDSVSPPWVRKKTERALEVRQALSKARAGKPLAFPTDPRLRTRRRADG